MNAALATSTTPQDPATEAAPEPITAAQRARAEVERHLDIAHPVAPPDVRPEEILNALPPGSGIDHAELPMAVVVMVITRDRITQHAHLHLHGLHSAHRNFVRSEGGRTWVSQDPDFIDAEDRIGLELAEFADRMDFPGRVAETLPRPPVCDAQVAAATAVEGMRHG